jgi:hypothetical protein
MARSDLIQRFRPVTNSKSTPLNIELAPYRFRNQGDFTRMQHYSRILSFGLSVAIASAALLVDAGVEAKTPLRGSASVSVKSKTKAAPAKQLNPRVPYTLSSGGKPVMIPLVVADLLKAPAVALPESSDFLRQISLSPAGNQSEQATLKTSDELMARLNATPDLFHHMDAIRQGYFQLPVKERNDLIVKLLSRYEASPDIAANYFDYGYAQLLYLNNQTGLFFLRNADKQLRTSATSLAYAMGQAQVDLNQEKAKPEEMTMRKLDTIHKIQDAVAEDLANHQTGFWPFYVQTIQKLSQLPPYQGITKRDISVQYVPVGNQLPFNQLRSYQPPAYGLMAVTPEQAPKKKQKNDKTSPVTAVPAPAPVFPAQSPAEPLIGIRAIPNTDQYLKFAKSAENAEHIKVTVHDQKDQVLGEFLTAGNLNVVEDVDKDGHYELVVRQYQETPLEPVRVYRWTGQKYELDANIAKLFQ